MKIGVLNIAEIDDEVFTTLLSRVSNEKRDRIKAFMFDKDKHRCLFADLLAQAMVTEFYNVAAKFSVLPSGKPVLAVAPNVHFNVSHAGDWVVCVVDGGAVGIDVEHVGDIDLTISDRFFCGKERENIMAGEEPLQKFFEYWTLKESYIKFIGEGLSKPLNDFCIEFLSGSIGVSVNGELLQGVYCKQYRIGEGYKMAVCAARNEFAEECLVYSVSQNLSMLILSS